MALVNCVVRANSGTYRMTIEESTLLGRHRVSGSMLEPLEGSPPLSSAVVDIEIVSIEEEPPS